MECEICKKWVQRRVKMYFQKKRLYVCPDCVLNLRTQTLVYCGQCGMYHFKNQKNKFKNPKRLKKNE